MDIPRNPRVLRSLLGPAWRGLVQHKGRSTGRSSIRVGVDASF